MFADIVFPTAVRRLFTYQVPQEFFSTSLVGKRVWVPYRNSYAIGIVINVHDHTPAFDVKSIKKVLDERPVLNAELLTLTHWIHKFYYCSWGEVIQAALPSGLNFVSNTYVRIADHRNVKFTENEEFVLSELSNDEGMLHQDVLKRWRRTSYQKVYKKLLKYGVLQLWEEPVIKTKEKKVAWIDWGKEKHPEDATHFLETVTKKLKWHQTLHYLLDKGLPQKQAELNKNENISTYALKKLKESGWLRVVEKQSTAYFEGLSFAPNKLKALNFEQSQALAQITKSVEEQTFTNFLLHGITGSGKTEVYIHTLKLCLEKQRGGIVLVPEIALTPQTVARFYQIFGDKIAILHSRMSASERLAEWKSIERGTKQIVIGPRSAVFAPIANVGAIILDEEHDSSYKQIDPAPRYHAREVAIMRANACNAVVIMGSATPSMQALNMVHQNKATLLPMRNRHANATLPEIEIIDLTQYTGAMRKSMSVALYNAVNHSLNRQEQVILLFNRRGFASYVQCATCGHIPQSPESSVSLTYHKRSNMLMCHYSGYARKMDAHCEVCGSNAILIQGSGTQKIEEEVASLFPRARILRFDKDSTTKKGSHKEILTKFGNGEADILVGTQLVAKGLDFPNVTTVGVIDADTEQAFPSFTASERLYQLLSQVAGRSGRANKKGKVYIQTRQAKNSAIQFASMHDYEGFAKQEILDRKTLNYPPFSRIVTFNFKGMDEGKVIQSAKTMEGILRDVLPKNELLGPAAGVIGWLSGQYIWELSLKFNSSKGANYIEKVLDVIMQNYTKINTYSMQTVRVNINVDVQR